MSGAGVTIRRLGPGDEAILTGLALDDSDFDLADRAHPHAPLAVDDARAYLADPHVLHWIAYDEHEVVGHLYCLVVPRRHGDARELLLYEIGVRSAHRRRGVGRALVATMDAWMRDAGVREVWVLADNPGATAFYRACGFTIGAPPVYLVRP